MKTTHLAEAIVARLNSSPGETWSDLTIGNLPSDFLHATNALDPINAFEQEAPGLYVIPVGATYNRTKSQGRSGIVSLAKTPSVIVLLAVPFNDKETDPEGKDVASWDEVKRLINLREEIDEFLSLENWEVPIREINSEPNQELPMKQRWFVSITEFEFEANIC